MFTYFTEVRGASSRISDFANDAAAVSDALARYRPLIRSIDVRVRELQPTGDGYILRTVVAMTIASGRVVSSTIKSADTGVRDLIAQASR